MLSFRDFSRRAEVAVTPRDFFVGVWQSDRDSVGLLVSQCNRGRSVASNLRVARDRDKAAPAAKVVSQRCLTIGGSDRREELFQQREVVRRSGEHFMCNKLPDYSFGD